MIKGTFNIFLHRPSTGSDLVLKFQMETKKQLTECEVETIIKDFVQSKYGGWIIKEYMGIS